MSIAKSAAIVCPECGEGNRATARFCTACAARLGAEPSASAPASLLRDSRRDTLRAVPSRPVPLGAAPSDTATFLVKFCIAGLIVLIGFIGWALYMLTANKAAPALPAGLASTSISEPVAASSAPPALAAPATSPVATSPTPAPAVFDARAAVAANAPVAERPGPETRRPASTRRQGTTERARPPVWSDENAGESTPIGGWVEPMRPAASTSSPLYQDAGPPIVQGPGPREPAVPAMPYTPTRAAGATGTQAADPGPPIAEGPGPRYDYSTPGAVGR